MAVPTFDKCMLPLLQFAADKKEHHIREAIEALAAYFRLTDEDRAERIPSDKFPRFDHRVHWANTYLKKAGLLQSTRRGTLQITERGLAILRKKPSHINPDYLMQFPEFIEFHRPSVKDEDRSNSGMDEHVTQQTPQEVLQSSYQVLRDGLAQELLDTVQDCSPDFFEALVRDLLLALGYGGAVEEGAGEVIGRSGDGGVDVVIKEDKLGFDRIYVQAKKWNADSTVGRPAIQAFAGSLIGLGANKGVFITTSSFSREAADYAAKIPQPKVILIDGQQLAKLMIDHNIGVAPQETYVVKKIDLDYFQLG